MRGTATVPELTRTQRDGFVETLKALGLGKMHRVTERKDTREVRGMIAKVQHLIRVVE